MFVQGVELLETGRIALPMREPVRGRLRAVRAGEPALADVIAEIEDVTARLERAAGSTELAAEPDAARVDAFLASAYERAWARG